MDKLQLQNQMVEIQEQHNRKVQDMLLKYQSLESTHEGTLAKLKISQVENDSLRVHNFYIFQNNQIKPPFIRSLLQLSKDNLLLYKLKLKL